MNALTNSAKQIISGVDGKYFMNRKEIKCKPNHVSAAPLTARVAIPATALNHSIAI
jgi:hypothetical protein